MKTSDYKSMELERALQIVDYYRSIVMDIVEQELGSASNWQFLRGRLLNALGDKGLSGRLRELLATEFDGGSI